MAPSPVTFARTIAAAFYLLPHCGLSPALVAQLEARLRTAALEGGARVHETETVVSFAGTAEERLVQLRSYLHTAHDAAPDRAEFHTLGVLQMLPAPRPHLHLVRAGAEVSLGGLADDELPGEEDSDPGIWPRDDEHASSVGEPAVTREVPR